MAIAKSINKIPITIKSMLIIVEASNVEELSAEEEFGVSELGLLTTLLVLAVSVFSTVFAPYTVLSVVLVEVLLAELFDKSILIPDANIVVCTHIIIINKIIENLKILVIFKLTSVLNILSICLYRNIL